MCITELSRLLNIPGSGHKAAVFLSPLIWCDRLLPSSVFSSQSLSFLPTRIEMSLFRAINKGFEIAAQLIAFLNLVGIDLLGDCSKSTELVAFDESWTVLLAKIISTIRWKKATIFVTGCFEDKKSLFPKIRSQNLPLLWIFSSMDKARDVYAFDDEGIFRSLRKL